MSDDLRFYTPTVYLRLARVKLKRLMSETADQVHHESDEPVFAGLDGCAYRIEQQWTHNFRDKPAIWVPLPVE